LKQPAATYNFYYKTLLDGDANVVIADVVVVVSAAAKSKQYPCHYCWQIAHTKKSLNDNVRSKKKLREIQAIIKCNNFDAMHCHLRPPDVAPTILRFNYKAHTELKSIRS